MGWHMITLDAHMDPLGQTPAAYLTHKRKQIKVQLKINSSPEATALIHCRRNNYPQDVQGAHLLRGEREAAVIQRISKLFVDPKLSLACLQNLYS